MSNPDKHIVKMLKKFLFSIVFLVLFFWVGAQSSKQENYIKKHKKIAISEMERAGVPASIKLAQGILESNSGKSTLAKKANNHFGMKCGNGWTGKEYYKEDDDYDDSGKLIKSCFRVYRNAKECYIAHSNFLTDPRKRYRYGFLFDLDPKNYRAWARGLKKAGYATSPTYADKLINVIETYNLDRFDNLNSDNIDGSISIAQTGIIKINNVKVIIAEGGETSLDIALATEVSTKRIIKYNERINSSTQVLKKDTRIFLQKKRNGYRGKRKYHILQTGETLFDLSQRYGIKLSKLKKRNRIGDDEVPVKGQKIKLRGWKVSKKNKPRVKAKSIEDELEEEMEMEPEKKEDEIDFLDEEVIDTSEPEDEDFDTFEDDLKPEEEVEKEEEETGPVFHTVQRGETLYGIARRYNTTVEAIMTLNQLSESTISIGQRLRIQ